MALSGDSGHFNLKVSIFVSMVCLDDVAHTNNCLLKNDILYFSGLACPGYKQIWSFLPPDYQADFDLGTAIVSFFPKSSSIRSSIAVSCEERGRKSKESEMYSDQRRE